VGLFKRKVSNLYSKPLGYRLAALALILGASTAFARSMSIGGNCQPDRDPMAGDGPLGLTPAACIQASAGAEVVGYAESAADQVWLDYGSLYGGVFVTPWLSAQAVGYLRDVTGLQDHAPKLRELYTDYAVLEVGSPILSRYRFTLGRMRLPFGIGQSTAPQFYQVLDNRHLWHSPPLGGFMTYDDLRRVRIDIGLASEGPRNHKRPTGEAVEVQPIDIAASVRAMLDISALEGTRLMLSGYTAKRGERRYGFGMVNVNHKGDTTQFEFVRMQTTPSGKELPFEQVLRLGYVQAWQGPRRWVVQFDDERLRFRRIVVDFDLQFYNHLTLRTAIGYRQRSDGLSRASRTSLTLGLEANL